MKNLFSIGELAKYQKISNQTLIYYDKMGIFKPEYIDPNNGYRYYGAKQLDTLDTILVLKEIGLSLKEIQNYLVTRTSKNSRVVLENQIKVLETQISDLQCIKNRLVHKCRTLIEDEEAAEKNEVFFSNTEKLYLLCEKIEEPFEIIDINIALKKCFALAFDEEIPIYLQAGVIVPYDMIKAKKYMLASYSFLQTEDINEKYHIKIIPAGRVVIGYHFGSYETIGTTYEKVLKYCKKHKAKIISDSYEFCITDPFTSQSSDEYITKILFIIE